MSVASHAKALAQAVHQVLSAHAAVQAELGDPPRLYDAAPEDPIFPYLTYGPVRSTDIGADGGDISRHQMTLHIWSRYAGRAEVFGILAQVEAALTSEALTAAVIAAAGQDRIGRAKIVFSDVLRAVDGRTLHGLLRMSFTLEPHLTE